MSNYLYQDLGTDPTSTTSTTSSSDNWFMKLIGTAAGVANARQQRQQAEAMAMMQAGRGGMYQYNRMGMTRYLPLLMAGGAGLLVVMLLSKKS